MLRRLGPPDSVFLAARRAPTFPPFSEEEDAPPAEEEEEEEELPRSFHTEGHMTVPSLALHLSHTMGGEDGE